MIVISDSVVLSPSGAAQTLSGNHPRIGWHNVVTPDNAFADEEGVGHPVANLGNPLTYVYWRGETTDPQNVGIVLGAAQTVNYVGIARHNFGSAGVQYTVEASTNGSDWTAVTDPRVPPDDYALIHEFEDTEALHFRLALVPTSAPPEIAVLHFGRVLKLQHRIYVGHTPLPFGRVTSVSTGFSEEGQFLGRVVRRRMYQSAVAMGNLSPTWYRSELEPFFQASAEKAFFFAWRPEGYPNETGFAWMTGDPSVSNQRENGMMQMDFRFQAIR